MIFPFNPSEKIDSFGQHFIVGLSGPTLDESDKQLLGRLKPAGILLLKRNFRQDLDYAEWHAELTTLLNSVREYVERNELLVSIDHEGALVHRTPEPLTRFPAPAEYATRATEVANAMAVELRSIGVNLSWAPLVDVDSNPDNPVIGKRAFGHDPEFVAECAINFLKGLGKAGVLACAKHFPGHGDTSADSHLELPVLEITKDTLLSRELLPFRRVIDAGVSVVMTAHILFPKIDSEYPATLSRKLLHDLIREKLGFSGVVVSDDLDMKAVAGEFRREESIVRALLAGCDMFIVARHIEPDYRKAIGFAANMARGLRSKFLSEYSLHCAHDRINKLFEKLPQHPLELLDADVFEENSRLAREIVGR